MQSYIIFQHYEKENFQRAAFVMESKRNEKYQSNENFQEFS